MPADGSRWGAVGVVGIPAANYRLTMFGDPGQTERWRSIVPDLGIDPVRDRTGIDNDWSRVVAVRQRYVLELKHLARTEHDRGHVDTQLTRIADWTQLTEDPQPDVPVALCRGVLYALAPNAGAGPIEPEDNFALLISIASDLLPAGPLFLDGVPLIIRGHRRFRPLPGNADELWPPNPAVPVYPAQRRVAAHWRPGRFSDPHSRGGILQRDALVGPVWVGSGGARGGFGPEG